jgi:hypothetical protein
MLSHRGILSGQHVSFGYFQEPSPGNDANNGDYDDRHDDFQQRKSPIIYR